MKEQEVLDHTPQEDDKKVEEPCEVYTPEEAQKLDRINELQWELDLYNGFKVIADPRTEILYKEKRQILVKKGVYEEVEASIREYCQERMSDIISSRGKKLVKDEERDFTPEEIDILKQLISRVKGKAVSTSTKTNPLLTPVQKPEPFSPEKDIRSGVNKRPLRFSSKKERALTYEDVAGQDPTQFVDRTCHIAELNRIVYKSQPASSPPPYSTVRILDVNAEDEVAIVSFVSEEYAGVQGTVKLEDLSPWIEGA